MARVKQSSLITEREFTFIIEGRKLVVPARIAPARAWFDSAESRDPAWNAIDIGEGKILALRASLQ